MKKISRRTDLLKNILWVIILSSITASCDNNKITAPTPSVPGAPSNPGTPPDPDAPSNPVLPKSSAKEITSFSLTSITRPDLVYAGVIDQANHSIVVNNINYIDDLRFVINFTTTSLASQHKVQVSSVDLTNGMSVSIVSQPVSLNVNAEDGSQATYTVTGSIKEYMYVMNGGAGGIAMFSINTSTGELHPLNVGGSNVVLCGETSTAFAMKPSKDFIYKANYWSGSYSVANLFRLSVDAATGALAVLDGNVLGGGLTSAAQISEEPNRTKSYPADITIGGGGKFIYVPTLFSDTVNCFNTTVDVNNNLNLCPLVVTSGEKTQQYTIGPYGGILGPTVSATDPHGKFLYVGNVLSQSVSLFTIDPTNGDLNYVPPLVTFGSNAANSFTMDASGKYFYALIASPSNQIQIFNIDQSTGALSVHLKADLSSSTVATGTNPIKLALHPLGNFAYVANKGSHNVSMYTVDSSGVLTPLGVAVDTGDPSDQPASIVVDHTGGFVYTINGWTNTISIFAVKSNGELELKSRLSGNGLGTIMSAIIF